VKIALSALPLLFLCACALPGSGRAVEVELEEHETAGGVRYTDPRPGGGETVGDGWTVVVHYTASLEDGTVFDSSNDRGVPEEITLGAHAVIEGWEQGMLGMRVGGQRRMVVPPELAWGAEGLPDLVPPHSPVVLVVDLLEARPPQD
jgi:FKBP-type peptidyl-prolyl cis-trans isomerase